MNLNFEWPIIRLAVLACRISPKRGGQLATWWFEYADRRYYACCGTWRWRFWFEITGQGHMAREYMRAVSHRRAKLRRPLGRFSA